MDAVGGDCFRQSARSCPLLGRDPGREDVATLGFRRRGRPGRSMLGFLVLRVFGGLFVCLFAGRDAMRGGWSWVPAPEGWRASMGKIEN